MTAIGFVKEELTPLDDWIVPDEVEEPDDELLFVAADAVVDEDAAVPGIVCALTVAKMPTPRKAAMELPTVSRCSRRRASSRDRARARIECVGFIVQSFAYGAKPWLGVG